MITVGHYYSIIHSLTNGKESVVLNKPWVWPKVPLLLIMLVTVPPLRGELKEAVYANQDHLLRVSVERIDVLIRSEQEILNFPMLDRIHRQADLDVCARQARRTGESASRRFDRRRKVVEGFVP